MKNSSTLIPKAFAVKKWPDSWIITTAKMATTKMTIPTHSAIRTIQLGAGRAVRPGARDLQGLDDLGRSSACPTVRALQRDLGDHARALVFVQHGAHDLWDVDESDLPFEEGHDGHLVRRVQHRRVGQAEAPGPVGEVDGRERRAIERLEGEPSERREVQTPNAGRQTIRVVQGELDRQ